MSILSPVLIELIAILALFAFSVYLAFHFGVFSLAQLGLMALGAYSAALLTTSAGWGLGPAIVVTLVGAMVLAGVLGAVVLRLRSIYLALATLAFSEMVRGLLLLFNDVTGGAQGLRRIPDASSTTIALAALAVVALVVARLHGSRAGRSGAVIRSSIDIAQSLGINVRRLEWQVFVLSGMVAALSGALYAHYLRFLSPHDFDLDRIVGAISFVVVGGIGHWLGPLLGTAILRGLPEFFGFADSVIVLFGYGVLMIVSVVLMPRGVVDPLTSRLQHLRARRRIQQVTAGGTVTRAAARTEAAAPAPGDGATVLAVEGVSVAFGGVQALRDVTFDVGQGQVLGLIGPNGAGKSTALDAITGLVRADSGRITLDGRPLHGLPAHARARAGIVRTFQHGGLLQDLTLLENVMLCAPGNRGDVVSGLGRGPRRLDRADVAAAMALFDEEGMADVALRFPDEVSYGVRRRAELLRARIDRPRVLLLDEPCAGMNPREAGEVAAAARRIAADGVAVVLIEHNLNLVVDVSDRMVVLVSGAVIADGPPAEVRGDPAVVDAYVGSRARQEAQDG